MWFSLPAELATSAGTSGLNNIVVKVPDLCNLLSCDDRTPDLAVGCG